MKKQKEPTENEARAAIYETVIYNFEVACMGSGRIATLDYVPKDIDYGTLSLAIQNKAATLFVHGRKEKLEFKLSDYINYCSELNNMYENFGYNELTIS